MISIIYILENFNIKIFDIKSTNLREVLIAFAKPYQTLKYVSKV